MAGLLSKSIVIIIIKRFLILVKIHSLIISPSLPVPFFFFSEHRENTIFLPHGQMLSDCFQSLHVINQNLAEEQPPYQALGLQRGRLGTPRSQHPSLCMKKTDFQMQGEVEELEAWLVLL